MNKGTGRILAIVGGGTRRLAPFLAAGKKEGVKVTIASFRDLSYVTKSGKFKLLVKGRDVASYDVVYIRLVGKRAEDASLLVNYASARGVRIVDRFWQRRFLTRLPFAKSLELALLAQVGVPVPPTLFATLDTIKKRAPPLFGFPVVVKDTDGKQARDVWLATKQRELVSLSKSLAEREKAGRRFVAEPLIHSSQRNRVFVIGGRVVGGFSRPTRWRKRFVEKINGEYPPGIKRLLAPVPAEDKKLALAAAAAIGADVAGVDILHEDKTGKSYVLEVNPAPRWHLIKKEVGVDVEREIVKFLAKLV